MRILLVSGGTGGHILPAISFGKWLKKNVSDIDVKFLSGSRSMELEIYRSNGIAPMILPLKGSPLGIGLSLERFKRWIGLFFSFAKSLSLFRRWKPDLCVVFGGYVSFAPLIAAELLKVPVVVHEQNSKAGRVTRIAERRGHVIASGWPVCKPFTSTQFHEVGVPVRKLREISREKAWRELGQNGNVPNGPVVAVLGGSLGSISLSSTVDKIALEEPFSKWSFLDVGGQRSGSDPANVYRITKRWEMSPVFALADMAISRGGASSLFELMSYGIPAITVPWRGAADDHQFCNACLFKKSKWGYVWLAEEESKDVLVDRLGKLCSNGREKQVYAEDKSCERLWSLILSIR